jgi:ATP-dependent RNA helicase DHX37/DHR1
LILGNQEGCLPYIVTIVAALSAGSPMIRETLEAEEEQEEEQEEAEENPKKSQQSEQKKNLIQRAKTCWYHPTSDLLSILKAVGAFNFSGGGQEFAESRFLNYKVVSSIFFTQFVGSSGNQFVETTDY